jgi:hypothetical protein
MPCYDDRRGDPVEEARMAFNARHNSPLAELLCEAMKIIAEAGAGSKCSTALYNWWEEHKKRDGNRP